MSAKSEASKNFAFVVGIACSHFEVLERLIRQDLNLDVFEDLAPCLGPAGEDLIVRKTLCF
jgi:hypothetical protein